MELHPPATARQSRIRVRHGLPLTLMAVVAVLCAGCTSADPSGTTADGTTTRDVTATTNSAPTTGSPTTTLGPPGFVSGANGWSLLPQLGEVTYSDYPIRAVAAGDDRLVAAGAFATEQGGDPGNAQPTIWVSEDGLTWEQLQSVPGDGEIVDVAWGNSSFVAVGSTDGDAAVWLSPDGLTWEQHIVPSPENGFAAMRTVIAVADGFFAAGWESFVPDRLDWEEADSDAAVWSSPDGLSWERIEDPVFGTRGFQDPDHGEFNSQIVGIADAGWGLVFAGLASPPNSNQPRNATVWILREEWERIRLGNEDQIKGVTAADGIVVVHGSSKASPSADAVFYVSSDGVDWQQALGDLTGLGGRDGIQFVNDVVFVPNEGWLAVGTDEKDFSSVGGAAVWTARPGEPFMWTRVSHDDSVFGELTGNPLGTMLQVTVWQDLVVVVGGQALIVDLGNSGSMCCEYAPSIWLFRSE